MIRKNNLQFITFATFGDAYFVITELQVVPVIHSNFNGNMKKALLFLVVVICSTGILKAGIVPQTDAARVAKNHYVNYAPGIDNGSIVLNHVYTKFAGNEPLYYIFNAASGNGFVIVSAEDHVYPILGYSFEGSFSTDRY